MLIIDGIVKNKPGRKSTGQVGPNCPDCGLSMRPNGTNKRGQKQWCCRTCRREIKEPQLGTLRRERKGVSSKVPKESAVLRIPPTTSE